MTKEYKLTIVNSSAELPDKTIIKLSEDQFKSLWVKLEMVLGQGSMTDIDLSEKLGMVFDYNLEVNDVKIFKNVSKKYMNDKLKKLAELEFLWANQILAVPGSKLPELFDEEELERFHKFMIGQTLGYDPETKEGMYYSGDIERFIMNKKVID